jgi:hypothetical protein
MAGIEYRQPRQRRCQTRLLSIGLPAMQESVPLYLLEWASLLLASKATVRDKRRKRDAEDLKAVAANYKEENAEERVGGRAKWHHRLTSKISFFPTMVDRLRSFFVRQCADVRVVRIPQKLARASKTSWRRDANSMFISWALPLSNLVGCKESDTMAQSYKKQRNVDLLLAGGRIARFWLGRS